MKLNSRYLVHVKEYNYQTIYNFVNSDNQLITINYIHSPNYENISFSYHKSYDDSYNRFRTKLIHKEIIFDLNLLNLIKNKDILNHKLFIEILKIKLNE